VCGNAAILISPFDVNQIKQAMLDMYANKDLRYNLIEKGQIQKQTFSWDISADLLWQCILKAIQTTE
jgi:hypothetical protein